MNLPPPPMRRVAPPSPPPADAAHRGRGQSATPRAMGAEEQRAVKSKSPSAGRPGGASAAAGEGKAGSKPKSSWKKCWDYKQAATYYKNIITKESRWASAEDQDWMEATDPTSGQVFLEHFRTGESRWKAHDTPGAAGEAAKGDEVGAGAGPVGRGGGTAGRTAAGGPATTGGKKTVWEELKEPGTGLCYYFSSASRSSQWEPPEWIDYFDEQENAVYYFNTRTKQSLWERPSGFVAEAVECDRPEEPLVSTSARKTAGGVGRPRSQDPSSARAPPSAPGRAAPGGRWDASPTSGAFPPHPVASAAGPKRRASPPARTQPPPIGINDTKRPNPPAIATSTARAGLVPPGGTPAPAPPPPPGSRDETSNLPSTPSAAIPRGRAASVTGAARRGAGASANPPAVSLAAGLPSPPPKPREGSPAGRWSPRGSVPPPPGPPPIENLPPAMDRMTFETGEEPGKGADGDEDDDDDDDIDIEAGAATG